MNIQIIWLASTFRLHGYLSLGGGSPAAGGHSGRGDDYRVRSCLFTIIIMMLTMAQTFKKFIFITNTKSTDKWKDSWFDAFLVKLNYNLERHQGYSQSSLWSWWSLWHFFWILWIQCWCYRILCKSVFFNSLYSLGLFWIVTVRFWKWFWELPWED